MQSALSRIEVNQALLSAFSLCTIYWGFSPRKALLFRDLDAKRGKQANTTDSASMQMYVNIGGTDISFSKFVIRIFSRDYDYDVT